MPLPSVVRIFFGIDLPESTKNKLAAFISLLKKKAKSHQIRWTKPENLHITLQFLAEAKAEHIPFLLKEVSLQLKDSHILAEIELGNLHLFPNPYRPRVIVLDVSPQETLAELSEKIGKGIQALNYPIEDRPFRGHLTLGRIKQPKNAHLEFVHETVPLIEPVLLEEVALFRSEPQPEGSKYTVLDKIKLQA